MDAFDSPDLRQLCEAVSIDVGAPSLDPGSLVETEEILITCSSLVRLSGDGQRIESAHFTVEEYLRAIDPDRKPHLARFRWMKDHAHRYRTEVCLTALNFVDINANIIGHWDLLLQHALRCQFYLHAAWFWADYSVQTQRISFIEKFTTQLFCSSSRGNFVVWKHFFILLQNYFIEVAFRLCRQAGSTLASDFQEAFVNQSTPSDFEDLVESRNY